MTTYNSFYIQPQPGYIICEPYEESEAAGWKISDNMKSKDSAGRVVAVGNPFTYHEGNSRVTILCPVEVGDIVIYSNYGDQKYLDFKTGKHLHFLKFHTDPRYNQIMGVVHE